MIFHARYYSVEYDHTLLRLEVVRAFEDQVLIVLRKKSGTQR